MTWSAAAWISINETGFDHRQAFLKTADSDVGFSEADIDVPVMAVAASALSL